MGFLNSSFNGQFVRMLTSYFLSTSFVAVCYQHQHHQSLADAVDRGAWGASVSWGSGSGADKGCEVLGPSDGSSGLGSWSLCGCGASTGAPGFKGSVIVVTGSVDTGSCSFPCESNSSPLSDHGVGLAVFLFLASQFVVMLWVMKCRVPIKISFGGSLFISYIDIIENTSSEISLKK